MQLTIDQALQQGVEAHKNGKLKDAERLYRAILDSQPQHPDANHNLGVLALSVNQVDAALPFFKAAIKANPKIEQFWLSYIDALIKAQQLKNAKQALEQANGFGFLKDKIDFFEGQFSSETERQVASSLEPPQEEVDRLIEHYQSRRFDNAEKLAKSMTRDFPKHPLAWKILGAVFGSTGRKSEALDANLAAVSLTPEDADAHSSLGATYKELGRLHEAEASCKRAIALQPNFVQAHYNLAITLHELNRLEEAEASYNNAITLKPDFAHALYNRSVLLFDDARYEAALQDAQSCNLSKAGILRLITLNALERIDEIYEYLEAQSSVNPEDMRIAAFAAFIAGVEKKPTAYKFCPNPLDFIHIANLSSQVNDTKAFMANLIDDLHDTKSIWEPPGSSTTHGFQSPPGKNLFESPSENIAQLKEIIINEINAYRSKYKSEPCPYIESMPSGNNLMGWYVVLQKQGHQAAHIHPGGWLSGVIYLKTVPTLGKDEGAIQFTLNGERYTDARSSEFIHNPKLGDLVLFPSCLHHKTVPFTTDTERIIFSFDLRRSVIE